MFCLRESLLKCCWIGRVDRVHTPSFLSNSGVPPNSPNPVILAAPRRTAELSRTAEGENPECRPRAPRAVILELARESRGTKASLSPPAGSKQAGIQLINSCLLKACVERFRAVRIKAGENPECRPRAPRAVILELARESRGTKASLSPPAGSKQAGIQLINSCLLKVTY